MTGLRRSLMVLMLPLLWNVGCAHATATLPIVRPGNGTVPQIADLRLPPGTGVVVQSTNGDTVRGVLDRMTPDRLEIIAKNTTGGLSRHSFDHDDILLIARVVKRPSGARRCLGAALGAAASLPFAISRFADMVVPGAIAGALIAGATGHSRAEVVFERRPNRVE